MGDPYLINSGWNGPDLVFTTGSGENMRVLAAELKNVTGNVDLGTLKLSAEFGDYGGSIERLARSAERYYNSSVGQLRLMCRAVKDAYDAGMLENALFTAAKGVPDEAAGVSANAQAQFNGVYRVLEDGTIGAIKDEIENPGFWTRAGAAASAAWSSFKAWGTQLVTDLTSTTTTLPLFYLPPAMFDPRYGPLTPWYIEPVRN